MKRQNNAKKRETVAARIKRLGVAGYSRRCIELDEERRAADQGFGVTRQAEALYRHYRPTGATESYAEQLERLIGADSVSGRRLHAVWRALLDHGRQSIRPDKPALGIDVIAERLFKLSLTVAVAPSVATGQAKRKVVARDIVLWLGDKLSQHQRIDKELEAHIGAWGISRLLDLVPRIFDLDADEVLVLVRTEETKRFFDGVIDRATFNDLYILPPTEPTPHWTGVWQGPFGNRVPLVSRRYSEQAVQQAIDSGEMCRALQAVNALGNVWYVINEPLWKVAPQLVPDLAAPPEPGSPDEDKQRLRYKKAWRKRYDYNADIEMAGLVAEGGRFHTPHNFDFRGRCYGVPAFNYTSAPDHIRSLFLMDPGEPLGDGLPWLKFHAAGCADGNSWSGTKTPSKLGLHRDLDGVLAERVAWVDRNEERLRHIAADVLNGVAPDRRWLPDKPMAFLAAVTELIQAIDCPDGTPNFITRLPISLDGRCSGLQHFCGLMRAPEGRLAGLVPGVDEDFYLKAVEMVRDGSLEILDGANDRKIVKMPMSIFTYGASPPTMAEEIKDVLDELDREASPEQIAKLAKDIHRTCGVLVPAAKRVRKFIGRLAKLYADAGLPFGWTVKSGFLVVNEYHLLDIKDGIAVRMGWRRVDMNLIVGDLPEMNNKKSRQSATANFVHSLDASHLHEVVWEASVYGIRLATAHDCFAALAPRAAHLNHIIRERYTALHALSFLMLRDMRRAAERDLPGVKLPEVPLNHGPWLDLVKVLDAPGWI